MLKLKKMTSKEFIIWLKGFTDGVHEYSVTPKQWDLLKEKLAEVNDGVGFDGFVGMKTAPITTLPHITPSTNPYKSYEVYCGDTNGTTSTPSMAVTTTPGQSSITYATPQFVTSTATSLPSGSTISYTNSITTKEESNG
jgi:hypothetical protein